MEERRVPREVFKFEHTSLSTGEVTAGFYAKRDVVKPNWRFIKMRQFSFPVLESASFDGYLVRLYNYLEIETNRLVKIEQRAPVPINKQDMQDIFGKNGKILSRQTLYRFLSECEEKNVLQYDKEDRAYYIHPDLANRGKGITPAIRAFFDTKDKEYEETRKG